MVRPSRGRRAADEFLLELLAEAFEGDALELEKSAVLRARVLSLAAQHRPVPTETVRGNELEWRESWPRVWLKVLKRDAAANLQLALFRLEPGATMPAHAHTQDEECIVIRGELMIGPLRLESGDLHVAHAGSEHPEVTSPTGALVFVRSQILAVA